MPMRPHPSPRLRLLSRPAILGCASPRLDAAATRRGPRVRRARRPRAHAARGRHGALPPAGRAARAAHQGVHKVHIGKRLRAPPRDERRYWGSAACPRCGCRACCARGGGSRPLAAAVRQGAQRRRGAVAVRRAAARGRPAPRPILPLLRVTLPAAAMPAAAVPPPPPLVSEGRGEMKTLPAGSQAGPRPPPP